MDIFQNSILSSVQKDNIIKNSCIPGIQSHFTDHDMMLWMEKITSVNQLTQDQSTVLQEQIYNTIQSFILDKVTSDKLINLSRLESLGFDGSIIDLLYQHTCIPANNVTKKRSNRNKSTDLKFESIFMSIFLNTHGVSRPHDLISALTLSIDMQKGKNDEKMIQDKSRTRHCLTTDIHEIIKECQTNHMSSTSVQEVQSSQFNNIKKQIEETVMCKLPFDETFLTIVAQTIIEPSYATLKFEEAVSMFNFSPENEDHKNDLLSLMKSHVVNLEHNVQRLKNELYSIVLPISWCLVNSDSTVVMDILLNIMLGCDSKELRAFKETLDFIFVRNLYLSDNILLNIDLMIKENVILSTHDRNIKDCMIKVWKKMSAFVAFMGLFRLIFPTYSNITTGRVDYFNLKEEDDSHKRCIIPNTVYFHKEHYYISYQLGNNKHAVKTKSFYELFYAILSCNKTSAINTN